MEKENKRRLKIIFILIATTLLAALGSSIIFDIIFLSSGWYPYSILRFVIIFIFIKLILEFSSIGKEFDRLTKKK